MWNGKSVCIVFPTYNEEENIKTAVKDFMSLSCCGNLKIVDEVIVVNNNSSDKTEERAIEAGARVITETKQGYGNALQRGLKEADKDIIVLCEPDGTFVAKDIIKFLSYSDEFQMVCGTRTYPGLIGSEANMRWFLRLGNYAVAKFMEIMYMTHSMSDCGCTFRLIHHESAQKIIPGLFVGKSHFLPNMIIAAKMNDVRFIEIPVTYLGRVGKSKITGTLAGAWKTGLAMIWLIIYMWPSHMARKLSK